MSSPPHDWSFAGGDFMIGATAYSTWEFVCRRCLFKMVVPAMTSKRPDPVPPTHVPLLTCDEHLVQKVIES